jgi:hypothetical protein
MKYTICPCGDNMPVEKFTATLMLRAVRYGMSVENAGSLSNPVPSGTECGDSHIAYLTARGKWVTVHFSTNILSPPGQRNHYMLFISHYLVMNGRKAGHRHCEERSNPGAGDDSTAARTAPPVPGLLHFVRNDGGMFAMTKAYVRNGRKARHRLCEERSNPGVGDGLATVRTARPVPGLLHFVRMDGGINDTIIF